MTPFIGELLGSAILLLLGQGVVANVVLPKTKGNGGGLIAITFGWAMAVFVGVFSVSSVSGAHLNPAVTIALAVLGKFEWSQVPSYILAQLLGAMLGSTLAWIFYRQHFDQATNPDDQLACFATSPAIKSNFHALFSEVLGTFILILGGLFMIKGANSLGPLDALPAGLLVLAIGLSLGGVTGYAINPTRDLGPRIMHSILPIKGKGSSNWDYAWIPVVGPIIGAVLAALLYQVISA
jgi:glycerol uptake facilitator protein